MADSFYAHGHPKEICQQKLTGARIYGYKDIEKGNEL